MRTRRPLAFRAAALALALAVHVLSLSSGCAESTPTQTERARGAPGEAGRPPAVETVAPVVRLSPEASAAGEAVFTLTYARPAGRPGPRMAEFRFQFGSGLAFVRAEALDAVTAAGKQLVAQERPGNVLRLLIFSQVNMNPFDSGPLARLVFRRSGDGPQTLDLLDRRPFFAPAEADLAVAPLNVAPVHAEVAP